MSEQRTDPEQAYKVFMTVWMALLVSQFLLAGVAFLARPELLRFDLTQPLLGENAVVIGVLALVSISVLAASFVLRGNFTSQGIDQQKVELVQTGLIVGCSLCEAVSLIGVFLAVAFTYQYFFLFSLLGIVGTVLHFPKRDDVHSATFRSLE